MIRGREGFTLVELLVAFFVFSVTLSGLLPLVTQSVAALSRAQDQAAAAQLGELRLREILSSAEAGSLPPAGVTRGQFPEPHEHYLWELRVEPAAMPLPEGSDPTLRESSTVFQVPDPAAPRPEPGEGPSLSLVTLLIHQDGVEPEQGQAFSIFVVEPALQPAAEGEEEPDAVDDAEGAESPLEKEVEGLEGDSGQ